MVRVWVLDPRSPEQAGSMVEEVATLTRPLPHSVGVVHLDEGPRVVVQEFAQWVAQTELE